MTRSLAVFVGVSLAAVSPAAAQNLTVVSPSPTANSFAARTAAISVEFDRPLNPATVTPANFWAFGRWTGAAEGPLVLSNGDRTVTLTPDDPFTAGDLVTVYLSHDLRAADGSFLRAAGYSFQFFTSSDAAAMDWRNIQTMTTRTTPAAGTRAYGGLGADLDNDGWLDLTVVNEDSADLRVFMNHDDGSGTFHPFLQPTFPVGQRASPNETGDFNRDGFTDVCVANINANTVSVLLGVGDGRFGPQQSITVGQGPRGVAVLDADGDGDQDIACTNNVSSNACVMLNNGSGVVGAPAFFEGGGNGEWSLGAADMTTDGILDLVIGARANSRMITARGNGNGTFTPLPSQSAGGGTWMIALGDLSGDGKVDVASANGTSNNAAILLGDGAGGFAPPIPYTADPFVTSSKIGDLDGDGDLDWILSSYSGDFRFMLNSGNGAFAFDLEIGSPQSSSCAVIYDIDNDHDLDVALIDEEEDIVMIHENTCYPECTGEGQLTIADFGCFQTKFVAQDPYADCTGDGQRTIADFGCFQTRFVAGCP